MIYDINVFFLNEPIKTFCEGRIFLSGKIE